MEISCYCAVIVLFRRSDIRHVPTETRQALLFPDNLSGPYGVIQRRSMHVYPDAFFPQFHPGKHHNQPVFTTVPPSLIFVNTSFVNGKAQRNERKTFDSFQESYVKGLPESTLSISVWGPVVTRRDWICLSVVDMPLEAPQKLSAGNGFLGNPSIPITHQSVAVWPLWPLYRRSTPDEDDLSVT